MLKYGNICEVNYQDGTARVHFDDINIVSGWLSLPTSSTKHTKRFIPLEVNTQVAVLMHRDGEQGEIVKAVWSKIDVPPEWANEHTEGIEFSDGTIINYNKLTHKLTIKIDTGIIELNGGLLGGLVKLDAIYSAINRLENLNNTHTHPSNATVTTNLITELTKKGDLENERIKQ
jgi:phage baseplate assembly protein gpV